MRKQTIKNLGCLPYNASFHHSEKITQICAAVDVKLVWLLPYSLDVNSIEEIFAEPKPRALSNVTGATLKMIPAKDCIPQIVY